MTQSASDMTEGAKYIIPKINVKRHWWIETGKYAAWPDIERRIMLAIRASDELHKREIGEYGSPQRAAFLATLDEVEKTMFEVRDHMRRHYGR